MWRWLIPALFLAPSAAAQSSLCYPHTAIVEALAQSSNERLVVSALSDQGFVLEVYASEAGTWTLIVVGTNGSACLIDVGTGLRVDKTRLGAPT